MTVYFPELHCFDILCNSCIMVCPLVRGDIPRALASGLSPVQLDKLGWLVVLGLKAL